MGKMTRDKAVKLLRERNPSAKAQDIELYADAWIDYQAAQANIVENGTIVFHPKTGSPIENPFFKIRAAAAAQMRKLTTLKTNDLWAE